MSTRDQMQMEGEGGTDTSLEAAGSRTSSGGPGQGQLNPLQNPVVLRHLFDLCPPETLANCRLVSKLFHDLSLTAWSSASPILVSGESGKLIVDGVTPLPEFLNYVNNPANNWKEKLCHYLHFKFWKLDRDGRLPHLWNSIANNVTTLKFYRCFFLGGEEFRQIIFRLCPNLQKLFIHRCKFPQGEVPPLELLQPMEYVDPAYGEHPNLKLLSIVSTSSPFERLPISYQELLSHFQALTSFSFQPWSGFVPIQDEMNVVLNVIRMVRERDAGKLPLHYLSLPAKLKIRTWDMWLLLQQLGLPLQSVEIEMSPQLLPDILELFQSSLKDLSVCYGSRLNLNVGGAHVTFPSCIPMMPNLEKLCLVDIHPANMEFLRSTPNIRELRLAGGNAHADNAARTFMVSNTGKDALADLKLSNLSALHIHHILGKEDLPRLAAWMPNVSKLEMNLNDEQFAIVCGLWRNLEELEVRGKDLTDKGVTGIGWDADQGGSRGNITHLRCLQIFNFWTEHLTDLSVHKGFLELPKLSQLTSRTRAPGIGQVARERLQSKEVHLMGSFCW